MVKAEEDYFNAHFVILLQLLNILDSLPNY